MCCFVSLMEAHRFEQLAAAATAAHQESLAKFEQARRTTGSAGAVTTGSAGAVTTGSAGAATPTVASIAMAKLPVPSWLLKENTPWRAGPAPPQGPPPASAVAAAANTPLHAGRPAPPQCPPPASVVAAAAAARATDSGAAPTAAASSAAAPQLPGMASSSGEQKEATDAGCQRDAADGGWWSSWGSWQDDWKTSSWQDADWHGDRTHESKRNSWEWNDGEWLQNEKGNWYWKYTDPDVELQSKWEQRDRRREGEPFRMRLLHTDGLSGRFGRRGGGSIAQWWTRFHEVVRQSEANGQGNAFVEAWKKDNPHPKHAMEEARKARRES